MNKASHLVYASDDDSGICRSRIGKRFRYTSASGRILKGRKTLSRIKRLVIPPAWHSVWICPDPRGHVQATGRDARGRKQYIYHPQWRAARDETKFSRLLSFAKALGKLRATVRRDLRRRGLPRAKVIAAIVQLLQDTHIRIGNADYVRQNGSFGLSTLRENHARVEGASIYFQFSGKSGIRHDIKVRHPRLAEIVKRCQDLPGQELFQFIDEHGRRRKVTSGDVNDYLRKVMGDDFSAKDFRTWSGTVLACVALHKLGGAGSRTAVKRNVVKAIATVAKRLGNTKTVCRKSYIHPAVINAYLSGRLHVNHCKSTVGKGVMRGLNRNELQVVKLLTNLGAACAPNTGQIQ